MNGIEVSLGKAKEETNKSNDEKQIRLKHAWPCIATFSGASMQPVERRRGIVFH
jgi:hypothetical protein